MSYTPYFTVSEYSETIIPKNEQEYYFLKASREIDILTFNRIVGKFDTLTEFQKDIVKEVCRQLGEFEFNNSDYLSCLFKTYSIGDVSLILELNSSNILLIDNVIIPNYLFNLLSQTGLCCRVI